MMARVLNTDLLHRVAQHAHEKYFEQQHYTAGLLYMIDVYGRAINGEQISIDQGKLIPLPLWLIITLSAVIIIIILLILTVVFARCCGKKKTQEYNLVNNRQPSTSP